MEDQIIDFNTAKLAKEKLFWIDKSTQFHTHSGTHSYGINEKQTYEVIKDKYFLTDKSLENAYLMTTQSLLARWLRETHKIRVFVIHSPSGQFNYEIRTFFNINQIGEWERTSNIGSFETYELAFEKGLENGLKLIKI